MTEENANIFKEPTTKEEIYQLLKSRLIMAYGEPINKGNKLVFGGESEINLLPDKMDVEYRILGQDVKRKISGLITKLQTLNK